MRAILFWDWKRDLFKSYEKHFLSQRRIGLKTCAPSNILLYLWTMLDSKTSVLSNSMLFAYQYSFLNKDNIKVILHYIQIQEPWSSCKICVNCSFYNTMVNIRVT
jgi:hypothetical protein